MKILLLGEYSRLHNSLKEGLKTLDYEVSIVGCGDNFKQFPVDYSIRAKFYTDYKAINFLGKVIKKILRIDIQKIETAIRFYLILSKLYNYNHVQLINSDALETYPALSRFLYKKLFKKIKSRSLLICGDETPIVDFLLKKELKYSILNHYFENLSKKNNYNYTLKYTTNSYRKTFNWLQKKCQSLITSDLDYEIPMQKMLFTTHFIPNPINIDKITYKKLNTSSKICIFLGINRLSYNKKGLHFFEEALAIIKKKYNHTIKIIIAENLPYNEYIEKYNEAHILLDQVYAYDQGYNALEAMAKGKVVFTGAETEFLQHYKLKEDTVCINAVPNAVAITEKLSFLIENKTILQTISKNARNFIVNQHNYKNVAKQYVSVWGHSL